MFSSIHYEQQIKKQVFFMITVNIIFVPGFPWIWHNSILFVSCP